MDEHRMDVRDLAPTLLATGELFRSANLILNGQETDLRIHVKATAPGSFDISFLISQDFVSSVTGFLSGELVTSAVNLKELIFGMGVPTAIGMFYLVKKLKGKNPKNIHELKEGVMLIEVDNETLEVPLKALELYRSVSIRKSLYEMIKPLEKDGVDQLEIRSEHISHITVTKNDLEAFLPPELADQKLLEVEHEAHYSIISLAFKEDNKWRLSDGAVTISATIKDLDFLKRVESNAVAFAKGDLLHCQVKQTQWQTEAGLKTEYDVIKVYKHHTAYQQMQLFDIDSHPKKES
jgi:hypothetical protein